jgi:KipI family sensor histidine kinase inhibitor
LSDQQLTARPLGDSAITISFGTERGPELLATVHAAARSVRAAGIPFVDDIVPAYLALTVFYDSRHASYDDISKQALDACGAARDFALVQQPTTHVIPVTYDGADLEFVASTSGLSIEGVVARHSEKSYTVDLLGFVPGWAYLSELDAALQLPRRAQPRPRVPAGSVAIAAAQTGIYPLDTPGGWHIIGRTTVVMFDPLREPPALFAAGDTVRFEPVA